MAITCDVILRAGATREQLNALGTALWGWCIRAAGNTGIYQFLDNQALTDLIAGRLPASSQPQRRGFHCWVRDEVSRDRRVTVHSLRREIPSGGVEDIFVDGKSWTVQD
jgi:transposase